MRLLQESIKWNLLNKKLKTFKLEVESAQIKRITRTLKAVSNQQNSTTKNKFNKKILMTLKSFAI